MKRNIKRQELILLSVWLIIIVAIVGDRAMRFAIGRFNQLDNEIILTQGKLERLRAVVKQESQLNAEYDKNLAGYKAIGDSDSLLQYIQGIAKKLNVNIVNIKPAATKEEAGYRVYTIRIEGQDDVYSIGRFLSALVEDLRTASIERLQINAQNRQDMPKAIIMLNALVFKP